MTSHNIILMQLSDLHHTARLLYWSYYNWDRAIRTDTLHGTSERDTFEINLAALMEGLGYTSEELRAMADRKEPPKP